MAGGAVAQRRGAGVVDDAVEVLTVEVCPTAVIAAVTDWRTFPSLWPRLLGEVWASLRDAGVTSGCPNVMLYLDDRPSVEVGVQLPAGVQLAGRAVRSQLPSGRVARIVHRGSYDGLGASHAGVIDWCASNGLRLAGPRWEVYGPHRDEPELLETEISYLLDVR